MRERNGKIAPYTMEEKNRCLPVERSGRKRSTGGSLDGSEACEGDLFGTKITDVDGGKMKKTRDQDPSPGSP